MIPPVVDVGWLDSHRHEVVVADVRWYLDGRSGFEAYAAGHIPGAVFVDLERDLSAVPGPRTGRHPLPDPAAFAAAMTSRGIGDSSTVVAYDDAGGTIAARLVWMLRALDRPAALLDGGLDAWRDTLERSEPTAASDTGASSRSTGSAQPTDASSTFTGRPWPAGLLADMHDAADTTRTVVDARDRSRYSGREEPVDARAGHIPGARSLPCRQNLGPDGRFLPVPLLRRRFEEAGVSGNGVISYCGSGVTACHNLLAMEYAGVGRGRLYPGSWSQYSSHPELPVETGD